MSNWAVAECVCCSWCAFAPSCRASSLGHNGSSLFPSSDLCLHVLSCSVQPIVLTPSKQQTQRDQALHQRLSRAGGGAGSAAVVR